MLEWLPLSYVVQGFKKWAWGSRARNRLQITPKILKQLKVSTGKKGLKRCLYAVGSFLPVFLWLFVDGGSCGTI